jgi:peptide/nickel transport system permease protein
MNQSKGSGFLRYLTRRLLGLIFVMWAVATIVFIILRLVPGDPVQILVGVGVVDPNAVQELRDELGLNRPLIVQYLDWMAGLARGDLGTSIRRQRPVTEIVAKRLPPTAELALISFVIGVIISLPAGIAAARHRGKAVDLVVTSLSLIGISTPSYVLGLLGVYILSINLGVLPSGGYVSFSESPLQNLKFMVMPALTLGLLTAGKLVRILRRNLVDEMSEDYVRTARAKGLREQAVFYGHVLRNAVMPYITLAGIEIGIMLSGEVIVENIFAIPGLGRLIVTNIYERDYPVVQGAVFVVTAVYVIVNLVVDLLYAWLDPKISLD